MCLAQIGSSAVSNRVAAQNRTEMMAKSDTKCPRERIKDLHRMTN